MEWPWEYEHYPHLSHSFLLIQSLVVAVLGNIVIGGKAAQFYLSSKLNGLSEEITGRKACVNTAAADNAAGKSRLTASRAVGYTASTCAEAI